MSTFKTKISRGQRVIDMTTTSGTAIAGSDAMELNIDATKMSKGDALTMLDQITQSLFKAPWPPTTGGGTPTFALQAVNARGSWMYTVGATTSASNNLQYCRYEDYICADTTEFTPSFTTYHSSAAAGPGYTVGYALEIDGVIVQALWDGAGATRKVLASGDDDVQPLPILASQFGLTKFAAGTKFYHRTERLWGTGINPPYITADRATGTFQTSVRAAGGTASQLLTAGAPSATGGYTAYPPYFGPLFCLGRVAGKVAAVLTYGASIEAGYNDTVTLGADYGYVFKASEAGPRYAHCNLGLPSDAAVNFVGKATQRIGYAKYFNVALNGYGGNDFSSSRSKESTATDIANMNAQIRAAGVKRLGQIRMSPKSDSTDSWATTANQTVRTNFLTFRAYIDAQVTADPNVTLLIDLTPAQEAAGLPGVWVVNGSANYATVDGTHPNPAIHIPMAVRLRAGVDALVAGL